MAKKVSRHEPTRRGKHTAGAADDATSASAALVSALGKSTDEGLERLFVRLIWRLGLVSRKDVNGLSQRLEDLERRLRERRPSGPRGARRKPGPPSSRGSDNSAA